MEVFAIFGNLGNLAFVFHLIIKDPQNGMC